MNISNKTANRIMNTLMPLLYRADSSNEKASGMIQRSLDFASSALQNLANFDDDDGKWVTTENGHAIHITDDGEIDKGNPHVIAAVKGIPASKSDLETAVSKCAKTEKSISAALKKAGYTGFVNNTADSGYPNFTCEAPDGGSFRVFVGKKDGKSTVRVQRWEPPKAKELRPDSEIQSAKTKLQNFKKKYERKSLPKMADMSDDDLYNYVLATSFLQYRKSGRPVKECWSDAIGNANAHKSEKYEKFRDPGIDLDTASGQKKFFQIMVDQMEAAGL